MHELWSELEGDALRAVAASWRELNWHYFYSGMLRPSFELIDSTRDLGRWRPDRRTIEIARTVVFEQSWGAVEEVLKHEMAHQFVDEVLRKPDETAHGPAFRSVCERIGIDPTASGPLSLTMDEGEERIIRKVARLLSLATSPNQNEAEAATIAARKLMLKHNVEAKDDRKRYAFKHLRPPVRRLDESRRVLGRILNEHFFVEVIWVRIYLPLDRVHATAMEVVGTPANLEIAEYVHAYLLHAASELWAQHKASNGSGKRGDRRTFEAGVMHGFREKLEEERKPAQEEGLVWVGDADLDVFFKRRHPRVHTVKRQGQRRDGTFQEGKSAGRKIVLRKGVETASVSRGRLLGSGD